MPKKINIVVVGDILDANGNSTLPDRFIDKEYTLIINKILYADNNYWQLFDIDVEAILVVKDTSRQRFLNFISVLKQQERLKGKPLLVVGPDDDEEELHSYSVGATNYFAYPINFRKIIALLVNLFRPRQPINNYSEMPFTTATIIKKRDDFFNEFKNIVLHNIDKGISVEKISSEMGVSTKTLTRRVKQYLFTSPARLVVEIKIEYAKKLLVSERFSSKKIAFMSGFSSPQHFNTVFKTQEGSTPMHYLKKRVKGIS
jgi:AraC-like DNA-binding protein